MKTINKKLTRSKTQNYLGKKGFKNKHSSNKDKSILCDNFALVNEDNFKGVNSDSLF
jgi:hypothetical protein